MESHERYAHQILTEIEAGERHSQRTLASGAGIALGLTNLLMRRFVRRGWVRVVRIRPNRVRYFLTPSGLAEKARMSRLFLQDSVKFYANARERVGASLAALSASWPEGATEKRIVFWGSGEVAEIAYVCLQETDLQLVGVAGDRVGRFFGLPIQPCSELGAHGLGAVPFDKLIVTSFDNQPAIAAQLEELGVPAERIAWL
ncbi:MAG: hypothetical protein EPO35_10995 [Acidobacteria bacterium]|nr:MAG: hypothetical protein EPO35_10995 [Acidobacteriota bacterium]